MGGREGEEGEGRVGGVSGKPPTPKGLWSREGGTGRRFGLDCPARGQTDTFPGKRPFVRDCGDLKRALIES